MKTLVEQQLLGVVRKHYFNLPFYLKSNISVQKSISFSHFMFCKVSSKNYDNSDCGRLMYTCKVIMCNK